MRVIVLVIAVTVFVTVGDPIEMGVSMAVFDALRMLHKVECRSAFGAQPREPR